MKHEGKLKDLIPLPPHRDWDIKLSHAEFAYNRSPSCSTKHTPFECVYEVNHLLPFTLIEVPSNNKFHLTAKEQADMLMKIHKQVHDNKVKANQQYQHRKNKGLKDTRTLKVGDFVWIHLRKERFPLMRKNKPMSRAIDPYQIIANLDKMQVKVDLPEEYGVSSIFNIGYLLPYLKETELRTIPSKQGGNEPIHIGSDNLQDPQDNTQDGHAHNPVTSSQKRADDYLRKTLAQNFGEKELFCYKGIDGSQSNLATCSAKGKPI